MTLIGIVLGIAGPLVSRLPRQTLFAIGATNPILYLALSAFPLSLLVTECASWFPRGARRESIP